MIGGKRGGVGNNLGFVEYNFFIINTDHWPQLVVEELLGAMFDVFREADPFADRGGDFLPVEPAELSCLVGGETAEYLARLSRRDMDVFRFSCPSTSPAIKPATCTS